MQGTESSDLLSAPPPFDFPTLEVSDSVAVLASNTSSTMRPAGPSRSPSEVGSSLSDSAYDLISSNDLLSESGIFSDDDAQTESLASFGDNIPDDGSMINSGDDSDEEDALDTPLDSVIMPEHQLGSFGRVSDETAVNITPTIGDSGYTSQTVRPAESSMAYFQFDTRDIALSRSAATRLVHTIQSVDEPNCNTELSVYDASYVGVDICLSVCNDIPQPKQAYRVAIMSYHPHFVGEVAAHIKSALDSSLFESKIDAEVQLDVNYCVEADIGSRGRREVDLHFDQHPTVTVRGGATYVEDAPAPLWDLAIFLHTSLAEIPAYEIHRHEATFSVARLAMASCSVPVMELSTHHPLYTAVPPAFTCTSKSLHLCVQTKRSKGAKTVQRELLPIDLDQFFAIDPRTLGKHLYCLPNAKSEQKKKKAAQEELISLFRNGWSTVQKTTEPYMAQFRYHIGRLQLDRIEILLGLLVALSAILLGYQTQSYINSTWNPAVMPTTPIPNAPQSVYSPALTGDLLKFKEAKYADVKPKERQCCAKNPKESKCCKKKTLTPQQKTVIKSDDASQSYNKWSVDVVGAHTLVVSTDPDVQTSKVSISVYQNGDLLDSLTKRMTNGASWAVGVRKDQAHGNVDVVVKGLNHFSGRGKVRFTYEFPATFGPTKTSLENIKSMVVEEVGLAQKNAKAMSTRMTTGLQNYFDQLEQSTQNFQRQAYKRVDETRKALIRLSSGPDTPTKSLWKKQQIYQLEEAKKALQKETTALARTIQTVAVQQYRDALQVIQAVQIWREQTAWPVRANDWRPQTALKRGVGNAKDLVKLLKGGPKKIDRIRQGIGGHAFVKEKKAKKCSAPIRSGRWR